MSIEHIRAHLHEAACLLEKVLADDSLLSKVDDAAQLMIQCIQNGGKIFSCGNGGSHCDAMHFAEELSGRYRHARRALPAMAISDPSHLSCVGNDYGFDVIFSRYIEALGRSGDLLLAISTSGQSVNIIKAIQAATQIGMQVVLLSGKDGGAMRGMADIEIIIPHFEYADRIQEVHIKLIHTLIDAIEHGLSLSQDTLSP